MAADPPRVQHQPQQSRHRRARRRRLLTRALPLLIVAIVSLGSGIYEAGASGRAERGLLRQYAADWIHSDYGAMYVDLSPSAQNQVSFSAFKAKLAAAAATATLRGLAGGLHLTISGGFAHIGFTVKTEVFGTLERTLLLPLQGSGSGTSIRWNRCILLPGLLPGEKLSRKPLMGARGTLLASNGEVLARGTSLSSDIPAVAAQIVGTLGPIPPAEAALYAQQGYPPGALVGQDGLEAVFQKQLAGRLGGELLGGKRILARAAPGQGETVRTTINPELETDAVQALGDHYAGITAMDPRTGAVEAAAGIAYTDVQPPGSTFKIITATAALQYGIAKLNTEYPYKSSIYVGGFKLQNAAGEVCGGTLINAFATSCDTAFAPLGVTIGATRLVATAERFGFNRPISAIPTALEATIPSAATIGGALSIGVSAIGQGLVQASTLSIADVGATIADHGRRPLPTMLAGATPQFVDVTTPKVAGEVQKMMLAVVAYGTGVTAQIPDVEVAGKTGTAELRDTRGKKNERKATDAWFVGYAPAQDPKIVVCALFPNQGYGEQTAAPAVRELIEDALGIG